MNRMKNVLVIAAHPDDEILGEGATVRLLADNGITVRALIMAEGITSRGNSREETDDEQLRMLQNDAKQSAEIIGYSSIDFCGLPDNRMDGVELLDVIKIISSYVEKYNPDTIFTHHHGDLNIDHRVTCEAVLTACRPTGDCTVKRIYAFETPSSTEWDFNYCKTFMPNTFLDITNTFETKLKAMECYQTESTIYPHPRSPRALRALAQYRGSNAGYDMAEAFMLLRELI